MEIGRWDETYLAGSAMDVGSDFPTRRVIWEDNKSYPNEIKICYNVDDDSDRMSSDNVVYCLPLLKDAHSDLCMMLLPMNEEEVQYQRIGVFTRYPPRNP